MQGETWSLDHFLRPISKRSHRACHMPPPHPSNPHPPEITHHSPFTLPLSSAKPAPMPARKSMDPLGTGVRCMRNLNLRRHRHQAPPGPNARRPRDAVRDDLAPRRCSKAVKRIAPFPATWRCSRPAPVLMGCEIQ